MTYTYYEDGGYEETIEAASMEEALRLAEEMARRGDWGQDGASIDVWVVETDEDGDVVDRQEITVEIEPNHRALIAHATRVSRERSCGDEPDDHDWTSEGEGGCDSNPGVWSTGGTSMRFAAHCRVCGLHRVEDTCGHQRNPGDHDTVTYTMPDSWCPDCESGECRCRVE